MEADEFDRSFLHLSPNTAVISTIDADHLEIYGDLQGVQKGFESFVRRIACDGHLILGPNVKLVSIVIQHYREKAMANRHQIG